MTIRLWIREDGERPCAVEIETPIRTVRVGRLVDVEARGADEARLAFETSERPCPDEEKDPQGFLEWRRSRRSVKEVTRD